MITRTHRTRTQQRLSGLMVGAGLVHAAYLTSAVPNGAKAAAPDPRAQLSASPDRPTTDRPTTDPPKADASEMLARALPPAVSDMCDAILEAVKSGRLDDLKVAFDLNELKPELAAEPVSEPLAFWRKASRDGEGRNSDGARSAP